MNPSGTLARSILFLSVGSALVFSAAAQAQFSKPLRIVTVLPAGTGVKAE